MSTTQIVVDILTALAIGLVAWYFWFSRREGVEAAAANGVQEIQIKVKGGYDPDIITVKRGMPVRLLFHRMESSVCSEMVIFDKLNRSTRLPEGETVAVEFTPEQPGEIPFQCQMGMLRGKVVVR
ncbi:cupredoxin domain-containing protein [Limnochorda pilosa]|uniref:Copper-exporting ATPase n=1 Tax=Limnochorda pilosa TaxID=1555112 RepID=A0A0K2SR27_LIMPI|nr:cupredoxin domain-containing protein [Limnochorda pilosa]BAS29274.1 copper-exporting ATPase [Limnochorda pilosa]